MRPIIPAVAALLFALSAAPAGAAEAIPLRGIAWQWCYEAPEPAFCLAALDAMHQAGFNVIMPEFGPRLKSERFPADPAGGLSRAEFRQFLARAKESGITVIPLLNSLDHGDRSIPWPARLGGGLDLGVEENYTFLFDTIDEYRADFAAAGLPMPYIHLGMDESSSVLLANAAKYGKTPAELLETHILRVLEFCRGRNLRLILYHDSLMSSQDPLYDNDMNYMHADRAGAWTIRTKLPRDLILMYWNYEPRERYKVVDGLRREGFEVWLMPWGCDGMRRMVAQAADSGIPAVIASTWMESGFAPGGVPGTNHLSRNPWLMEALAETAECTLDPARCTVEPADDPVLRFVNWFFPAPADAAAEFHPAAASPASWPGSDVLTVFGPAAAQPVLLGAWPAAADNLSRLRPPLRARTDNGEIKIDAVNVPRGENQLVLYTRQAGNSTGCNGFGTEATVAGGKLTARTTWGVGDSAIPADGFVLSGHGNAAAALDAIPIGGAVTVIDADGTVYGAAPGPAGNDTWQTPVGRSGAAVTLTWCAARPGVLDGATLGTVRLHYTDGSTAETPLAYGRDFFSWDAPGFFWGRRDTHRVWNAVSHSAGRNHGAALTGWRWTNPAPEKTIASLEVALNDAGKRYGLVIAGWQVNEI